MNEFKMVVEDINSKLTKVVEVVNHRFDQLDGRVGRIEKTLEAVEIKVLRNTEQIRILHEGQDEIKNILKTELNKRVTNYGFKKLEKRIAHLENKTA